LRCARAILGLFGLVGAGRTELFRLLSGLERASAGSLELCGQPLQLRSPRDAIAAGVLLCPEDRKKEGIIPLSSVAENINISAAPIRASAGCCATAGKTPSGKSLR
jgi:L-arabinose transport system ATP-binding protein